jgi:hypothetical protein
MTSILIQLLQIAGFFFDHADALNVLFPFSGFGSERGPPLFALIRVHVGIPLALSLFAS